MRQSWSSEEIALLREKYPTQGADIPELLATHSPQLIRGKAHSLGISVVERGAWTEEEIDLLTREYATQGWRISALTSGKSKQQIQSKAQELGLKMSFNPTAHYLNFEGSPLPVSVICNRLGIKTDTLQSVGLMWRVNKQESLDIIYSFFMKQSDGAYKRLSGTFRPPESRCVHFKGKRWSIEEYCKEVGIVPSVAKTYYTKHQCTADEAVQACRPASIANWTQKEVEILNANAGRGMSVLEELLVGKSRGAIEYQAKKLGLSLASTMCDIARSLSKQVVCILRCSQAFVSTDGVGYFYLVCSECHNVLLVSEAEAKAFNHGVLCSSHTVPSFVNLPPHVKYGGSCHQ